MKFILPWALISNISFLLACSPASNLQQPDRNSPVKSKVLPKTQYYVDVKNDGIYLALELENPPEPIQGSKQWMVDFYRSIKYPASARQQGISGVVVLNAFVDTFGQVSDIEIHQSLHPDCDQEAKRAFYESISRGYKPMLLEGNTVKFRVEVPVGFWLE